MSEISGLEAHRDRKNNTVHTLSTRYTLHTLLGKEQHRVKKKGAEMFRSFRKERKKNDGNVWTDGHL
jgi:hypothetical protein